jgi:hypothetical protein
VKISSQYLLAVATESNMTTRAESNHSVANIYVDITTSNFWNTATGASNTEIESGGYYILDFPAPTPLAVSATLRRRATSA